MPLEYPKIFFAIPCGEYYSVQHEIIQEVCIETNTEPIVIEDHIKTKDLWRTISKRIDNSDLFVADVSSGSFNIALELGYALNQKTKDKVGIFISENRKIPADLRGFVWQEYYSFSSFQEKLERWICDGLGLEISAKKRGQSSKNQILFQEDFKSQDFFLRRWFTPPGAYYELSHEGLRFTSGTLPILTTNLGLLRDYEIEFRARIQQERLGWIIQGTKSFNQIAPGFCVMLQIDETGNLTPHIWNSRQLDPKTHWQVYPSEKISLKKSQEGWFTINTKVEETKISILQNGKVLFSEDFSKGHFSEHYKSYPYKEGQIGFRCCGPGEIAVINYVKVRGL